MAAPTLSFNTSTLVGSDAAGCTTGTARSGLPEWALLCRVGRNSRRRNATTARSHTSDGFAVEVSFWLVDPPGVSYFSVSCPGYQKFTSSLICAEDAFVLFSVTPSGSTQHYFVYTARGRGPGPGVTQPSLQLLPRPSPDFYGWQQLFGLLPRGGEHFAVASVGRKVRNWTIDGDFWRFDTHVFLSETRAWRSSHASLAHLSVSDKRLCDQHTFSKQIRVGAGSLGWVDTDHGILLLHNLFDNGRPLIDLIPLPRCASRYNFFDVACCDDGLIKLVEIKSDGPGGPGLSTGGEGWRATVWNRRVSWDGWQKQCTVHVDDISVDPSYSALLPELQHDGTQELELKKLIFYGPILSVHDDDILCMMAKVNDEDHNAWAITIDMEHGMVEALAQFPAKRNDVLRTMYCSCVFPKYLNIAQGGSSPFFPPARKKRKKRTRSSRRKKKQQPQVLDRRQGLLYLLCIVGCILIVIIVRELRRFYLL